MLLAKTEMAMPSIHHSDRVHSAVETAAGLAGLADVPLSWRRSLNDYHVDPDSVLPPRVLTQYELKDFRDPAEKLIEVARGELDRLYSLVCDAGYVILLCDANGIAIDHRGKETDADQFKYWGIWLGGVWSEDAEGTNGIGTCINALHPVAVHRDQHFRARHIGLSCSGAPIFGPDCKLAGVLDVSSMDPAMSERAHALSLPITTQAARAITQRLFRKHFVRCWIIVLAGDGVTMTLAVDADRRIVGADRYARRALKLDDQSLRNGERLWTYFERDDSIFRGHAGEDVPAYLERKSDNGLWRAIVTSPAPNLHGHDGAAAFHFRPRLTMLADMPALAGARQIRGGLSPSVLRRVQDYMDARLDENISLEALSDIAGLSVWHFAHAFKQAVGVAPHTYLVQRRVERGRALLTATNVPLSEIALSVGFTDQSHFARHFRRRFGMTPSQVRRTFEGPDGEAAAALRE
jgi:AraC-like DNA-binding protein